MTLQVALHHVSHYRYDRPVQLGPQVVRLRPAPHCRSPILSYSLRVEPTPFINWQQDPFANYQARLVFPEKTREFKVTVDLVAEMAVYNPFDFFLDPSANTYPFTLAPDLQEELAPYRVVQPAGALLQRYLQTRVPVATQPQRTLDFLVELNRRVQEDIRYLIRMEAGVQSPEETLRLGSGSCRDSTWLLVNVLRHCGLAARFVSGYLIQLVADVKALDGPSGAEQDFTDLHAWCEVYLPGAGWIGLDPTSGLLAGEGHLPLACTPMPASAAPISGMVDEAEVVFSHEMTLTRVLESPRVTQPYTASQWASLCQLGDAVDQRLHAQDVRLTMGGEPTFVAQDDRDAPEWNTEALGPTKRGRAMELVDKLRHHYAPGGFLHLGQGKWYPGEQLPRWALSICWRADGQPCWQNPARFANENAPQNYTTADAERFIRTLAQTLGIEDQHIRPGFEDTWYYLWRERRLPVNVDPFASNLEDPLERARLRRVFAQGLASVVGFVLPLQASGKPDAPWQTGPWVVRDERLYLVPGDSPMGWRLPLDALPWVHASDYPHVHAPDPSLPREPLGAPARLQAQHPHSRGAPPLAQGGTVGITPGLGEAHVHAASATTGSLRTALCVEVRNPGRANGPNQPQVSAPDQAALYVFMPPLAHLEDYLALVHAIEVTAEALGMALVLEGYPPPRDPRLKVLQVTPDPGVIEVNIHPAQNWQEVVEHTEFLYQSAFEVGLSAEKFMTDGRHTGTGGGNHLVLGGATPNDSPFLRRPDLLASLILYWHNHPSLSYLFSGLFIGPTSQAPRVDEARNDQVYELEIALREIELNRARYGQDMPPWLIDRMLRNILIDVTGNTHRSEFCIDKLYSPDSATGRLGLVELRGFEMPPHARMSVAQQLLLRALVVRFWEQPYRAPVTRWGTELHDRFMLPYYVQADFDDVLTELGDVGLHFDPAWFAPHFEFRFPCAGQWQGQDVHLELRHALEPWHVMGEEGFSGGTVRYVDSSLERLQVLVRGLNPSRHTLRVNNRPLPLQSTGTVGEYVAGVRYRAWAPPSALHPTIGVHAPLTFDVVDTWMKRSIGGCQYHVMHPGGRHFETLPVNANEAQSRRLARFFANTHSPGRLEDLPHMLALSAHPEFPFTLDLRR